MSIEDHLGSGMTPDEARRQALIQFGGIESAKESCRDQQGFPLLDTVFQDLRFGARQLRKNPGFAAVAVITLALGVGANTAIFSVVDAVLLRPLPYPDSGQLVWLCERGPDWSEGSISYPNFNDWRKQQSVFETFGAYSGGNFTLTGAGEPARLAGVLMSADVFAALRFPGCAERRIIGLSLLGTGVGLLLAAGALRVVAALAGGNMPRAAEISLDLRVLLPALSSTGF